MQESQLKVDLEYKLLKSVPKNHQVIVLELISLVKYFFVHSIRT